MGSALEHCESLKLDSAFSIVARHGWALGRPLLIRGSSMIVIVWLSGCTHSGIEMATATFSRVRPSVEPDKSRATWQKLGDPVRLVVPSLTVRVRVIMTISHFFLFILFP